MRLPSHASTALRRLVTAAGFLAIGASIAYAQGTQDTSKKPATKTVPPPATKTKSPPATKTVPPAAAPVGPPATKTTPPPAVKTTPPPAVKTAVPPGAKAISAPATTAATPTPQQSKAPAAGTKAAAPAPKTVAPPPGQTKAPATATKAVTPPVHKNAAPSTPEPLGFLDRVLVFLHLRDAPAKAVVIPTKKTAGPTLAQTKAAPPPSAQTRGAAPASKVAAPPGVTKGAPGSKTVAPAPTQTTPASTKPVTPPPTKTASAPKPVTPPPTKTAAAPQPKTAQGPVGAPPATAPGGPATKGTASRLPAVTGDTAAGKPLIIMREVFSYDPAGRRDPFLSLLTTTDLRPTLTDLKIIATIVDEPGRSVALLQDNNAKKQVNVRVGTRLGRMRVANIRPNVVVFTIEEFGTTRLDSLQLRDLTKVRGR